MSNLDATARPTLADVKGPPVLWCRAGAVFSGSGHFFVAEMRRTSARLGIRPATASHWWKRGLGQYKDPHDHAPLSVDKAHHQGSMIHSLEPPQDT